MLESHVISAAPPVPLRSSPVSWRQLAQAAVVLSACLLAFLGRPLSTGGYYAATDLLQVFFPFHISPGYHPKNGLLGDTVLVYHPYLQWNRSQLEAGRLPLWNP